MSLSHILCFLCVTCVTSEIFFSKNKEHGPKKILLASNNLDSKHTFHRLRRGAGDNRDSGLLPDIHTKKFPNENETEAYVHWTGDNSNTVYVLTIGRNATTQQVATSTLWRSGDFGKTYSRDSKKFPKDALIDFYYISNGDRNKLIFTDAKVKKAYITVDDGQSYEYIDTPALASKILFHPTESNTLLLYANTEAKLYVSYTFGHVWALVAEDVMDNFYWGNPAYHHSHSIHMLALDKLSMKCYYKVCIESNATCTSTKDAETEPTDVEYNSLHISDNYTFLQHTTIYTSELYVSYRGEPFKKAVFPQDVQPQNFHIVSTSYNQVFLATDHWGIKLSLFTSDLRGIYYIVSLESVLMMVHDHAVFEDDIHEVGGLPGVYLVNQVEDVQVGVVTKITYNQGLTWKKLPAPQKDIHGQPLNCKLPNCSLNLHLSLSSRLFNKPYALTEDAAPGIILAQGLASAAITNDDSSLYYSSDAGISWKMVLDGDHFVNILDQGNAIVALHADNHGGAIKYSWNEGETWTEYKFTNDSLHVYGMLNEPGITSLVTSIYGRDETKQTEGWTVTTVDFSKVLPRNCTPKDLTTWKALEGKCLLGQKLTFQRRLPTSQCHCSKDFEFDVNIVPCSCGAADYECDFGYVNKSNKCVADKGFDVNKPIEECPEGEKFQPSNGYRKIASDNCTGDAGQQYRPRLPLPCPTAAPDELTLKLDGGRHGIGLFEFWGITLEQFKGSKKSTEYTWDFGNGTIKTFTGFEGNNKHVITYNKTRTYTVKVHASNSQGSRNITCAIHVEIAVAALFLDVPKVAQKNKKTSFEVIPITGDRYAVNAHRLHYVWDFGDQSVDESQQMFVSFSRSMSYTYSHIGPYSINVRAINTVSSVQETFTIDVYERVAIVSVTFKEAYYIGNEMAWRVIVADKVKDTIVNYEELSPHRIEVSVLSNEPLIAEVAVVSQDKPTTQVERSVDDIVSKILKNAKSYIIDIGHNMALHIDSAGLVTDEDNTQQSFVAVYICVPILVLAVFVSMLVILYYKKKFSTVRRYATIRDQSEAGDSLLENDDDDDDVPPLDPNPDRPIGDNPRRRTDSQGRAPALVMMSANLQDDDANDSSLDI